MATLQKLDILSMGRLKTTTVEVDGGQIIVSELGATDTASLYADPAHLIDDPSGAKGKDGKPVQLLNFATFKPALVVRCIVDESGSRLFTDEDAAQLARLRPEFFHKIADAAMDINGLSAAAEEAEVKN